MHEGHRERLKKRFLNEGLDSFEPHNVVELLLFFAIPKRDVNETAHLLIDRFGSVAGVLDAGYTELNEIPGIKSHSAFLINLITSVARRYYTEKNTFSNTLDSIDKVGRYMISRYIGVNVETVYLLLLNNDFSVIECAKIFVGSVNSAHITPRSLVERALLKHASSVILVHNHPGGIAIPSTDDLRTTNTIASAFNLLGINFIDHIIVARDRYTPLIYESGVKFLGDETEVGAGQYFAQLNGINTDEFYRDFVKNDGMPDR